jgi:drug/metabolite transporter (DMT)-like permease
VTASADTATSFWFATHAVSSIGLTLANKKLARAFCPYSVILCQNAGSALFTLILGALGFLEVTACSLFEWGKACLSSALLVGVCWTNLSGMRYISVPMYVVGRNVVPILTALGEGVLLKSTQFRVAQVAPLIITLAGSALYATGDQTWEARGLHLALANAIFVTFSSLLEKKLVSSQKQSPVEVNMYRCITSVPLLLVLTLQGEAPSTPTAQDVTVLLLTCFLAFGIGVASFQLQARVAVTSIQVANVAYKLLVTIASLFLFPVAVTFRGWAGYAVSFLGFVLYVRSRTSSQLPPAEQKKQS